MASVPVIGARRDGFVIKGGTSAGAAGARIKVNQ